LSAKRSVLRGGGRQALVWALSSEFMKLWALSIGFPALGNGFLFAPYWGCNFSSMYTRSIVAQQGLIHRDLVIKSIVYNLLEFGNKTLIKVWFGIVKNRLKLILREVMLIKVLGLNLAS